MNRRSLQLTLIVAVTLLAQVGAGGLPRLAPPVAHAATSFTWTGQGLDGHWNTAKNWSPNGVPGENGSGDSVTIGPAPGFSTSVSSVPQGVTLQDLTLAGHGTSLSGGSLTVTGSFDWSGDGALQTPLTVAGTASISDNGRKLIIAPATLTVAGTTSVSGTGLTLSGPAILTNTGTLTFQPGSSLSASSCCLSPAQLVNTGSVVVPSSLLGPQSVTLNWVAFNDQGAVSIGANSALSLQVAPSTFASGVSFTGGGTLRIENTAAVRLSGNVTLGSGTTFELDPTATLTGTATMRSAAGGGTFSWTGGTLAANLTVAAPVSSSISGASRKVLDTSFGPGTGLLTLSGPSTLSDRGLVLNGPAVLTNTGTLTLQPGALISASSCCVFPAQLVNTGTVVVPAPPLSSQITTINGVAFNDRGAVSIGANSALELQIAPSTFASGVSFSGGGTFHIDDLATVRLSGNVTLGSGTTFDLGLDQNNSAGVLTGTATMRGAAGGGTFSWTGGTLAANLTVAAPVTGSISGPGRKVLDASFGPGTGRLTLSGPSTLSGAAILNGAAILTNTGTLTLQPGALISASSCCVFPAQLVNTGTVVVPAPPLSSQITTINGVAFNDRGTVSIGPNSALELQIAPSTFASGVSFSGGGTFHIDDQATVRLSGNVTLGGGTTFDLGLDQNNSAGVLTGTATLRGAAGGGTFSWTGGTLSANLTVAAPVTGSISGPGRKVLDASFGPGSGRLTLSGPSTLSGAAILNGAAILTNTGTLTLQPGAGLSSPVCCVHPAQFVNTGTLSSTVGASNTATLSSVAWTNSGTVDLRSGTVAFGGPNYTQTKGTTKLDGGALAVATGSPLVDLQGGSLTGQGVITSSLSNAALVDPGRSASTPGQITIIGNYNQTNKGKLRVDLKGSTTPGTDYDQLAVSGTASLTGTLDFETTPGFTPTGSDSFAVVTSTTRTPTSRQFTTLTSSSAQAAQYWVQYQPTAAVLALTGMRWGVDSADTITSTFYSTVKQTYGTPAFWARYIGDPNTSFNVQHGCNQVSDQSYQWKNITAADVAAARNDGFDLLPVYFNYPKTAVTGATCGQNYAKAAIEFAQHWTGSAIPQGTAIFVDIEFDASTDAAFLKGWYDEFNTTFPYTSPYDGQAYTYQAGYYKAGYYGDTGTNATITNFDSAYCAAVSQEPAIGTNSFIWTIRPGLSRTTKTAAPAYYRVIQPPCGSQTVAWQYGLNDPPTPPDVDTDEAVAGLPLWHP